MRYFWSLILVLALVTAGLYGLRRSQERAAIVEVGAPAPATAAPAFGRPARPADPAPATPPAAPPAAESAEVAVQDPDPTPAAVPDVAPTPEPPGVAAVQAPADPSTLPAEPLAEGAPANPPPAQPAPSSQFSIDELLGVVAEAAEKLPPEAPAAEKAATQPEPTPEPAVASDAPAKPPAAGEPDAVDPMLAAAAAANEAAEAAAPDPAAPTGPSFEVRADGSLSVEGVGVIPGAGTAQRPFVLNWDALRSLSRDFNPRQGQEEVPAWVMQLDGKHVRVEGNTLLPVVAQTTNELLVMQNPWDGCCLGVPPTPYDAIEVKLATMQRMGNSPTGYGQVEGVFKVDPYIVSGWLLGLYLIENASFESAAGVALPEL
jgi:hypothetical protein